ncbi:type IA DNA topoisomerase (plasmid) [Niallia circulans]|uniref:DNA topoisomerase n=1 Tax=Niallia circulans TaxID=1397 RepID=A0A553SQW9_NIACI|nr:type IA DNA topoisomerase [Niallia circulans]TRZ39380.1 type IA DNA topoisomerase [Niallia circulans]
MKITILAEKPDQARKYATALGSVKKGNGFLDVDTNILNGEVVVTWGIGHLVELASMDKYGEQYKKWNMENLPFQPEKMLYEVKSSTRAQFSAAKKQLEEADLIIIATDPDREGENIAYSIFSKCSAKVKSTPKKRLWINSMVDKEIQRGFQNLKDSKDTFNYFVEAQTRQISDYLVGMNFTQFFTLLAQSKGLQGVYSLGRVQTPCNSLVVQNDLAIKNFQEETFYKLFGNVTKDNKAVKFTNDTKYPSKEELAAAIQKLGLNAPKQTNISSVKKEMKAKKAPKLFNLGGIQSYANKKWKYSLDKSLKTIQTLYQEGFLSYPRTDCDLITTNEFEYLKANLEKYKTTIGVSFENVHLEPRKEYVNNDKVLEHYAIIPTEKIPTLSSLDDAQRNIYQAVVRNTVLMFAEDYIYESTAVTIDINGSIFTAKGIVPKNPGWTKVEALEEDKKEEIVTLPAFVEGESVLFVPKTEEGKTKPPSRLTEASLGGKGGLMDKLGLGTPATRSSIIKTLIDREYIRVEKTKLYPTQKGSLLYNLTKNILLGSPDMTAKWEDYLKKIGTGTGTQKVFLNNISNFISGTLNELKKKDIDTNTVQQVKDSNKQEIGSYLVKEEAKVYKCMQKGNTSEEFFIFKNISGKKISISQVKQLLTKGKTGLVKGFVSSKTSKKFDAHLVLKEGKVSFEFAKK